MDQRVLDLDGVQLAIAEAGVGQRPLLLLHGFTGAKENFTEWLEPLAEAGWHAVAPDLRGHGQSTKFAVEGAYSFEILADDALRLADALDWPHFTLLGHSMGGMVAQYVALRAPSRIEGLVLMDTGHGPVEGLDPDLVEVAVAIVRAKGIDGLIEALADHDDLLGTEAHQRLLAERPGYAEFEDRKFRTTDAALYAAMAPEFAGTEDRLDRLTSLPEDLPVLVIVGEQDRPFIASSQRMAEAVPDGTLAVIAGAGHSPQFESPDAWWAALSGFLAARL